MRVSDIGELELLQWLYERLGNQPILQSLNLLTDVGDDAAVIKLSPTISLVVTTDALIEDVHFRCEWASAMDIGWKALAVNVSDLAAMFAEPIGAVVSIALPESTPVTWVQEFYDGILKFASTANIAIVGGDTVRSPRGIAITVTAFGNNPHVIPKRSNAQVGDMIVVTGTLGDSALGLRALSHGQMDALECNALRDVIQRHLQPQPRWREGLVARAMECCKCAIDISDGLVMDLDHIAQMSQVVIELWLDCIPISEAARKVAEQLQCSALETALYGGEDYELLMAIPEACATHLCDEIHTRCGTQCTIIGRVLEGPAGIYGITPDGKRIRLHGGYEHFKAEPAQSAIPPLTMQ